MALFDVRNFLIILVTSALQRTNFFYFLFFCSQNFKIKFNDSKYLETSQLFTYNHHFLDFVVVESKTQATP